jgi:cyclic-di-GMP-binding biofilm dispersal mediator protein
VKADSANRDELIAVVEAAGALDIMVINAGVGIMGDPLTMDPDAVDRLIDINVRAVYFAGVEAGRQMHDNGRIIIIGSISGDRAPWPGGTAYGMSKSAVQGIGRGLARDFGARGITVNVVQPGPVDTDMNPADGPMAKMMHAGMAIKRHATADEVASLVLYLASPAAAMITGTTQTIDGGVGI